MPDKIVNHFVLADGSVARLSELATPKLTKEVGFLSAGAKSYTKAEASYLLETISTDYLYSIEYVYVGTTTFDGINRSGSGGAYALKVDLKKATSITYPVFKSTSSYGSFMFDKDNICIWKYDEKTATTGTLKTISVPDNADWMLVSISSSLSALDWTITVENKDAGKILDVVPIFEKYGKDDIANGSEFTKIADKVTYVQIGENYTNMQHGSASGAIYEIPCKGYKTIKYPVFETTSRYGSVFVDENNIIVGGYANTSQETGEYAVVDVPANAIKFALNITSQINTSDWYVELSPVTVAELNEEVSSILGGMSFDTPFKDTNKNLCLAGIKTAIVDNKIPFHEGFLFHKLQNNDNTLWYGKDLEHISKIGSVSYNPTLMRFAISPKDGRIIATQRDTRNGIWVWDGETETHLNSFSTNPQAWLYNSGVDFINYNNTEYCVFAEYIGTIESGRVLNVWRGTYPYTSASNWEIVMSQTQVTDITHFHMVRRDPWTNVLYLTAGDSSSESKWWYSTDGGATWTLLVSGTDVGWENSLARTINFIFTKDYIYWATDHGQTGSQHHTLNRVSRDSTTGIIDPSTKEQLALLPQLFATNSLCYVESPNGLFMYDRVDTTSTSGTAGSIKMLFWNFETEELETVVSLGLTEDTWGGSRGKCYVNYTNSVQPYPAMGFSIDTPCIFDLVYPNVSEIGTISYRVGSKTVEIVQY